MVEQRFRQQETLGHYRLLHLLGRGGFAEVYLGEHIHLQTQAAVKVLRTQLADEDVQTFRREAQTVARLLHPNIVRVLDFGVEDGLPYLVMDYAPNGTLRRACAKGKRVPLAQVVSFTAQMAEALQYAHDRRLIHRDVKPENMLLGQRGETLLSDFGIALVQQSSHLASTQNIAGTVAYMAPEQIQGHPVAASDQYALGIVVYEWLCAVRPFEGSYTEIAVKQTMVSPLPPRTHTPDLSPAVEQVVLQALHKDPRQRFADVRTFAQALEQAAEQRSPSTVWRPRSEALPAALPNPLSTGPTSAAFSHQSTSLFPSSPPMSAPGPASFAQVRTPPPFSPGSSHYSSLSTPGPLSPQGGPSPTQQPYLSTPPPYAYPGAVQPCDPSRPGPPAQHRSLTRRALLIGGGVVGLIAVGGVMTDMLLNRARTVLLTNPLQGLQPLAGGAQGTATPVLSYAHSGQAVWVVRWSPDGKYIASGSLDGLMQIWTADTGVTRLSVRSTVQPARSDDYPWSIAWSPQKDRKVAVSFVDGTIQVLDAQTAQRVSQFAAQTYGVSLLAWSPDERYLAVGASDSMVHVYSYPAWQVVTLYQGHTDGITTLAWSPDGKTIASGSQDTTVRLWNPLNGHTNLVYTGHSARIGSLSWAPDSTRLVSTATSPDQTARVWQVEGGTTLSVYAAPAGAPIGEAMWSHDGRTIAIYGGDAQIHLLDAQTGKDRQRFFSGIVLSLSWSPDDTRIVTGNEGATTADDVARVWQVG
ncbi:MAG TPA: protein kinase [Ktedonobacteraceae bacterium]|jgi:serine/threonine protein kinase/WD40 repeat protein